MVKKGSPQSVVFFEDLKDKYMIHVAKVKTSTGDTVIESQIIRPDLEQWIELYKRKGYVEKEN